MSLSPSPSAEAAPLLSAPAHWDRTMFLSLEGGDNRCPPLIDITGGSRVLVFGPYAQLAGGLWRAKVSFEICEEAARRKLAVQMGTVADSFTTVDVPPGVPGRHDIEVTHPVKDGEHIEIRIWLKAAAFHGELRFFGATIEPIADAVVAQQA